MSVWYFPSFIEAHLIQLQLVLMLIFDIWGEFPKESFWVGSAAWAEPALIWRGDTEVPGHRLFGSKEWTHMFDVSTIILASSSGNSQWDVQPFLHLPVKPEAPLHELEQSEGNYQLNLRMNWGSERVPPWLLFNSSVYCSRGLLRKNYVAFWKRRLFHLLVVGRSSNYSPSCLYYGILGFTLLQLPCAVWDAGSMAEKSTAKACCYNRSLLPESLNYFRASHHSWAQLILVCALESVWETGQSVPEHKVPVWLHSRYSIEWRLWWQGMAPNWRWTKHSYPHSAWKAQFWPIPPSQSEPLSKEIKGKEVNPIREVGWSQWKLWQ